MKLYISQVEVILSKDMKLYISKDQVNTSYERSDIFLKLKLCFSKLKLILRMSVAMFLKS